MCLSSLVNVSDVPCVDVFNFPHFSNHSLPSGKLLAKELAHTLQHEWYCSIPVCSRQVRTSYTPGVDATSLLTSRDVAAMKLSPHRGSIWEL